jgi:hypothetical protein
MLIPTLRRARRSLLIITVILTATNRYGLKYYEKNKKGRDNVNWHPCQGHKKKRVKQLEDDSYIE